MYIYEHVNILHCPLETLSLCYMYYLSSIPCFSLSLYIKGH